MKSLFSGKNYGPENSKSVIYFRVAVIFRLNNEKRNKDKQNIHKSTSYYIKTFFSKIGYKNSVIPR